MTLNQLIHRLLKPIAEDHLQINDFGFGDISKLSTTNAGKYPIVWAVVNSVSYDENAFNYSVSLVFADLIKDDHSNVVEAQSDMIQIAADFAAKLVNSDSVEFEVDRNFSLKPFTDRFVDLTAGVVMDIKISCLQSLNDCKAPFKTNI